MPDRGGEVAIREGRSSLAGGAVYAKAAGDRVRIEKRLPTLLNFTQDVVGESILLLASKAGRTP